LKFIHILSLYRVNILNNPLNFEYSLIYFILFLLNLINIIIYIIIFLYDTNNLAFKLHYSINYIYLFVFKQSIKLILSFIFIFTIIIINLLWNFKLIHYSLKVIKLTLNTFIYTILFIFCKSIILKHDASLKTNFWYLSNWIW